MILASAIIKKMELIKEQRVAIKFCFRPGFLATETLDKLNEAYGEQTLKLTNIFEWFGRFCDGREFIEEDECPRRPV